MNLHEAKDEREAAQDTMREAINVGIELIQHLKTGDEQLKEEAIRDGLDGLKNAFGRYNAAHREGGNQLILEVEKKIGGEDEAAFTQVIEQDEETGTALGSCMRKRRKRFGE